MNKNKNLAKNKLILNTLYLFQKSSMSLTVAFSLMFIHPAMADGYSGECLGGTIMTANSYANDVGGYCDETRGNCNGKTFCWSNEGMPWWSCFLWCQANHGTFATQADICPNTATVEDNGTGACANVAGIGYDGWRSGWVNHPSGPGSAFSPYPGRPTDAIRGRVRSMGKNATLNCFCI